MAEAIERVLTLRFKPDLSEVDSALSAMEQRASRIISFGTGTSGGAPTFSAEGPAVGGGPAPVPGAPPPSPGAGGFRPATARGADVESERLWAIRERTALIGADPDERLRYWQRQSASMETGTIGRAKADEQVARAEQAAAAAQDRAARESDRMLARAAKERERTAAVYEKMEISGATPQARVGILRARLEQVEPGDSGRRADLQQQIQRAEQQLAKAKEREAAAAERAAAAEERRAAAEERRAAAAQKSSARGYAADDRAYQRELKGRRSAMSDALKGVSGEGDPKSDLEAIAEAAEEAAEEAGDGGGRARGTRGGGYGGRRMGGFGRLLMPYFLTREALRVGGEYFAYRDDMALGRTEDERMEAGLKWQKQLESIPIAGQLGSLALRVTGRERDMQRALRRRDEAKADEEAGLNEFGERVKAGDTAESVRRRAGALNYPSSFGRQKLDIQNEYSDWKEAQETRIGQLRREATKTDLKPEDRARMEHEADVQAAVFKQEDAARQVLARAQLAALERQVTIRTQQLGLDEPGLRARLEGRVGVAGERDFEAGLRKQELEADQFNAGYGREVRRQNVEKRRIRQDEIVEGITERDAGTAVLGAETNRRPQEAANLRFAEERRVAEREYKDPDDLRSRLSEIDARERQDTQRRNDQIFSFSAGLKARNDQLSFQLGNTTDPRGLVGLMGAARGTLNETLLSALRAGQSGNAGGIADILKGGQMELQLQRRQYVQGFEPTEADPSRTAATGEGTADVAKALKEMADDLKVLQKAGENLESIKQTIQQRLGVAL